MVLDIITDLKSKGVDVETSLDLRTGDRMGSLVLRGRADFNPEKELRRLYKEVLGKDKASDVKSGEMVFSKTYDDNDKVMCSKIRLRLHNPEICQQHITNASIAASMGKTAGAIRQNTYIIFGGLLHRLNWLRLFMPMTVKSLTLSVFAMATSRLLKPRCLI